MLVYSIQPRLLFLVFPLRLLAVCVRASAPLILAGKSFSASDSGRTRPRKQTGRANRNISIIDQAVDYF